MADEGPRVAMVTGASRGIGAATAHALARDGRRVVLVARDAEKLEAVREEIESAGGSAVARGCDVSDGDALAAAVEAVAEEEGRLDILVNNAGITRDNLLLRMKDEEFDDLVQVNLRSAFVACRAAARPMMRQKWGRIVNLSSVAGLVGNAGQSNYAATKAGLIGFTRSVARELGSKGVTANAVAPGYVETDMTEQLPSEVKSSAQQATALNRLGQPAEIADAVAFLASERAAYITGQVLAVDGGMTMC